MSAAPQDRASAPHITIYCDDRGGHARKTVDNFVRVPATKFRPAYWTQRLLNGNRRNSPGTALLIDDVIGSEVPPEKMMAIARGEVVAKHRTRFNLACRTCHARNKVAVREERLSEVLDRLAKNGVSEVSLHGLAGIVSGS